jgi:hypothetical protein
MILKLVRVIYFINLAWYNVFPVRVSGIFSVISYPFALSSYLLFTLYWQEMMTTSSVVVHPFIVKLRIPFYVICAALLSLDVVRIILLYTTTWEGMPFVNCKCPDFMTSPKSFAFFMYTPLFGTSKYFLYSRRHHVVKINRY